MENGLGKSPGGILITPLEIIATVQERKSSPLETGTQVLNVELDWRDIWEVNNCCLLINCI